MYLYRDVGINAAYMSGVILHLRQQINISLNIIVCCYKKIAEAPARYNYNDIINTDVYL